DYELEFLRLFDREIRRLCTFQNLVNVSRGATEQVGIADAVEHEAPVLHIFWPAEYSREPALHREVYPLLSLKGEDRSRHHEACISALLARGLEGSLDIIGVSDF